MIPEEFLYYVWEQQLFYNENIRTAAGENLEIINIGRRNYNSGPDFFNAKVKIGQTIWAGNVEIHKKSSDWQLHNHHADKAYDSVILHVVEENDKHIFRTNGDKIPVFCIKYPEHIKQNYRQLLDSKTWIACQNQFHKINPVILQIGFNRLMIERLEAKTNEIIERLHQNNNDWNETFYHVLARMFGFKINSLPFEMLAKSLPLRILAKHRDKIFQLEALFFGNSGLLNQQLIGDNYYMKLREEYSFFFRKYKLSGIEGHLWKFMRLRPVNFPTVRISQMAALIHRSQSLISKITETELLDDMKQFFDVKASEYWDSHYNFNKFTTTHSVKNLGENSINLIIINVVIPFLFVFGEIHNKNHLKNRALDFLERLPAEKNSIVNGWKKLGIECRSAFESQALIQLKNMYCDNKKCLNCHIGVKLVKTNRN
ncbi:MAG: DUF2851 family protein [Bacteroidales bacterium]|jgi:hypothetical protein|nr:DUF2851 family protein [Bacteroidales bacterium]